MCESNLIFHSALYDLRLGSKGHCLSVRQSVTLSPPPPLGGIKPHLLRDFPTWQGCANATLFFCPSVRHAINNICTKRGDFVWREFDCVHLVHFSLGRGTAFSTIFHVRWAKIQIRVCVRAVRSKSSLSALRRFESLATKRMTCRYSDQTVRMRRLIWVFARRTWNLIWNVVPRLILIAKFSEKVKTLSDLPHSWIYYHDTKLICLKIQINHGFSSALLNFN